MRGSTLPFAPMKTHGPIFVDLRDKFLSLLFSSLSLSVSFSLTPLSVFFLSFLAFYPFIFFYFLFLNMCQSLIRVRLCPETIYFFSVQFILNELSSIHFLTSEIFVKLLSLKSLVTYHLENRKNIPIVSEFDETFMGH